MTHLIVRASDISHRRRATKFTKTRKILRTSVEILSNTYLYNISERPVTPKLSGVDYVAKNWALAMMLKALPFELEFLVAKEKMLVALATVSVPISSPVIAVNFPI